jgi:hypothetical protein
MPPDTDLTGALAVGYFSGGQYADLVARRQPGHDQRPNGAGAVTVLYGSAAGLTTQGSQFWTQGTAGVPGAAESGDGFGFALAAGRFSGQNHDDLFIGVPWETIGDREWAGAGSVLYGSATGLRPAASQLWSVVSPTIPVGSPMTTSGGAGRGRPGP